MDKIKNLCDRLEIVADHLEEQGCLRAMAATVRETIEVLKITDRVAGEAMNLGTFRLLQDSDCRKCNDDLCRPHFDGIPAEAVYIGITDGKLFTQMSDGYECFAIREVEAEG